MSRNFAVCVSKWAYEEPYDIYSGDGEDVEEFLNGSYYSALDHMEKFIGFYCFGSAAQVPAGNEFKVYEDNKFVDIGLGMSPELCGQGNGYDFFMQGLEFGKNKFPDKKFRLTVASFNKRAIRLYEKIGFKEMTKFDREKKDNTVTFIVMELQ